VWICVGKAIGGQIIQALFHCFFSCGFSNTLQPIEIFRLLASSQYAGHYIRKLPNKACFEGKLIKSPIELIFYFAILWNIG
jgi:hypothetical protein